MARRKTHEEFVAEVKSLYGGEYTVMSKYSSAHNKIKIKHNKCGEIYEQRPSNFLNGHGCKKCGYKTRISHIPEMTHNQFVLEVEKIYGDEYTIQSEYVKKRQKVTVTHNICGNKYEVIAGSLIRGKSGCPYCAGVARKTTQQFKDEVSEVAGDDYIVVGKYVNNYTGIRIKHNKCGHVFSTRPANFLNGTRCPKCNESKGERKVREWLEIKGVQFIAQSPIKYNARKDPLKLDFYVEGVAVEYDGEQHYRAVELFGGERGFLATQRRDAIKNKYCADNGIPLIRIPYWEYDNIDAILTEKLLPLIDGNNANLTESLA